MLRLPARVVTMGGVLAERVEELRSDHSHGGSWMARRAVEALAELASESAESSAKLLERLDVAGHELAATRREMGAIAGAVGRVLAAAHHGAHLAPEELRRLVQVEVSGLVGSRDRAAAAIAIQLRQVLTDAFVLTHSASATVREAVVYTHPELVICTVSAPFEEGRGFAEDLRSSGVDVELVDDADAERALERASLFLIGADTVFACEVIKLAPIDAPEQVDDEHFDVTPPELVDEIVTEEGAHSSENVRSLVDRTPFLSEGYAVLR